MPSSVYIHIPFCKSKCNYCSFVSFNKPELIEEYVCALIQEIQTNYHGEIIETLYFGGGTPSLLPIHLLEKVIQQFRLSESSEVTLELNPENGTYEYIQKLKQLGINRLSIGSQTFDNKILKIAGRRHSSDDIIKTIQIAQTTGFQNISADLIYGLPIQTKNVLEKDLEQLKKLNIQHVSTYGLKIEESSYWGKHSPQGLPDDDMQADMYEMISEYLENHGFKRYEISNFSIKGYESKHNLNYWNNHEYYGFGVAAHGYIKQVRYSNSNNIEEYVKHPLLKKIKHKVSMKEKLEEEIFLGFRKAEGINVNNINSLFNIDFEKKYKNILHKYSDFFTITQQGYALNQRGILVSNLILAEFIE